MMVDLKGENSLFMTLKQDKENSQLVSMKILKKSPLQLTMLMESTTEDKLMPAHSFLMDMAL